MQPFIGHDNYQKLYVNGEIVQEGARSDKRIGMINWGWFKNKRVIDIGCNSGMLSRAAKKAGASQVVGIDLKDVVNVAKELTLKEGLDIAYYQCGMESAEFEAILNQGWDYAFFCAMFNHIQPDERVRVIQLIDRNVHEKLYFETNFEHALEKFLPFLQKYMTFDKMVNLGFSGDRKPEDYHLVKFERREETYSWHYLQVFELPLTEITFCHSFGLEEGKLETERKRLDLLKESIKTNGLVRPLAVRFLEGRWVLYEGGHRYLACQEIGVKTVPVKDVTKHPRGNT